MDKKDAKEIVDGINVKFAEETAKVATKKIIKEKDKCKMWRHIATCTCIALCVMAISAMTWGIISVNRYFQYQESLIIEVESAEDEYNYSTEGGGNNVHVEGSNNDTAGGDMNGKNEN